MRLLLAIAIFLTGTAFADTVRLYYSNQGSLPAMVRKQHNEGTIGNIVTIQPGNSWNHSVTLSTGATRVRVWYQYSSSPLMEDLVYDHTFPDVTGTYDWGNVYIIGGSGYVPPSTINMSFRNDGPPNTFAVVRSDTGEIVETRFLGEGETWNWSATAEAYDFSVARERTTIGPDGVPVSYLEYVYIVNSSSWESGTGGNVNYVYNPAAPGTIGTEGWDGGETPSSDEMLAQLGATMAHHLDRVVSEVERGAVSSVGQLVELKSRLDEILTSSNAGNATSAEQLSYLQSLGLTVSAIGDGVSAMVPDIAGMEALLGQIDIALATLASQGESANTELSAIADSADVTSDATSRTADALEGAQDADGSLRVTVVGGSAGGGTNAPIDYVPVPLEDLVDAGLDVMAPGVAAVEGMRPAKPADTAGGGGGADFWKVTIGGYYFNLDPATHFGNAAWHFRRILLWVISVGVILTMVGIVGSYVNKFGALRQASSPSAVPGVSAGLAQLAAVVITAACVTAVVGMVASVVWLGQDPVSVFAAFGNPFNALPSEVLYLVDMFFPLDAIVQCAWAVLTCYIACMVSYMVVSTVARHAAA